MSEIYVGTKFETRFVEWRVPDDVRIIVLRKWCHRFAELGVAPAGEESGAGNLSFRTDLGFIITAAGANLGTLTDRDFVEVIRTDIGNRQIYERGVKEPSSESFLHDAVYRARPEVNAVFHGHDEAIMQSAEKLEIPVTMREQPYGTPELAAEVVRILNNVTFLVIRNHGFLSPGKNMKEAGQAVVDIKKKIESI